MAVPTPTTPPTIMLPGVTTTAPPKCTRCSEPAIRTLRTQLHCNACFSSFIRTKIVKRLESFRLIRRTGRDSDSIPTFIVPLSFGVASTALLDLLCWQLEKQRSYVTGPRYKVVVVHVDERILIGSIDGTLNPEDQVKRLKAGRFKEVEEWVVVKLEDIYDYRRHENADEYYDIGEREEGQTHKEAFEKLMHALPSPTSRMDLAAVLRTRLVAEIGKRRGCEGLLWGDTTTKLAQKTLSETAKGRGFALPWMISDGMSPYGIKFLYPLRELFLKELVTYAKEIVEPPLMPLCAAYSEEPKHSAAKATSGRNITVDELMTQYFEQMETQYPAIVSNVVRTAGKLKVENVGAEACTICGLPGDGGSSGLTLGAEAETERASDGMCYGCLRSTYGASDQLNWPI